jgi:hypothetical protein
MARDPHDRGALDAPRLRTARPGAPHA